MASIDGQRLRAARKRRRLSRQQLGEALGRDARRVSQWEAGTRAATPTELALIAGLLMVDPGSLLQRGHRTPAGKDPIKDPKRVSRSR